MTLKRILSGTEGVVVQDAQPQAPAPCALLRAPPDLPRQLRPPVQQLPGRGDEPVAQLPHARPQLNPAGGGHI